MSRKYNFSAGPCTLPVPVLEEIRDEMVDFKGTGMSLIEASHRSKAYDEVHNEAMSVFREVLGVPDNFKVMFLGGGATMQFTMIPMNLMAKPGMSCDFTMTGAWAKKAYADAKKFGDVRVIFDGKADNYMSLPDPDALDIDPKAAYLHITSNETIGGIQWKGFPDTGDVPLVADMSSDIMSRPLPMDKFSLIYAGAQKNLGPAGMGVVILRDDLLERCADDLPAYMAYKTHAPKDSLYNTPPVFAIWAMGLTMKWVKAQGGVAAMQKLAEQRAAIIYGAMNDSGGFYSCPVPEALRSNMNIVWRLPSEDLEKQFVVEATAAGMTNLKGHRSVGGCRASVYNAMPVAGAETLASFMAEFSRKNG
jgi:phosphoserine aminotransferase